MPRNRAQRDAKTGGAKRACSEIGPRRAQRRSKYRRNLRPTRNPGERLCREIARSAMQKQAERSEPVPKSARAAPSGAVNGTAT